MSPTATKWLGMVMFARTKQLAIVGVAAGLAWVTVANPGAVYAQSPRMHQGDDFTCPDVAGINYVRDPEDSNAYYLCVDGSPRQHARCPQISRLIMGSPPKCIPYPHTRP